MRNTEVTDKNDISTSRNFVRFVKTTYGIPVRRMYNLKLSGQEEAFGLRPPYILLSNHVNTFDPILISVMHNRHIHWVAADTLFRNRYLRFILRRLIGTISKSKSRSDYYTIKQITKSIKRGGVVGMFPEGQRTWDGRSLPLFYATAKLVRMLKVPVVICTLEGGYHTLPRWSAKRRRGELTIAYQKPIMPEELSQMKVQEIYDLLTQRLHHDAYEYQRKKRILFSSARRAEYVEHVLYICPSCGKMDTLRSAGNDLCCGSCGYTAHMDEYGFFTYDGGVTGHDTVSAWNDWQQQELRKRLQESFWAEDQLIFSADRARLFSGYRDQRMKVLGDVQVGMSVSGITVTGDSQQVFPLEHLESLTVAMQRNLEFYADNTMYRIHFVQKMTSAYKYLALYEAIQDVQEQRSSIKRSI